MIERPPSTPALRHWPIAVAYLVVGFAAYYRILGTFFVADDFSYLDVLSRTDSPSVIFSVLAGRYFRPAVVFVYYVNYQLSALSPWTYHASVVFIHVANAWLIFLLGRGVAPSRSALVPALAGGLFLVFGGHAEAVTWIGGMADPLVTFFLLLATLLFLRSLSSPRPLLLLAGCWLAFAGALLSKESAAVLVGLIVATAALGMDGWPDRARVRRTMVALSGIAAILVGYFLLRRALLGFTFVNLEGLGTNTDLIGTARAFLLRSFMPQGSLLIHIWVHRLDLFVLVPCALVLLWRARRSGYRVLALLAAALALTIAPVLPLSIALATPESERLIYLPSAFACLFAVWLLDAGLKRPPLVVAATLLFAAWHVRALDRTNRTWVTAAELTRSETTSFGEIVRQHWRQGQPIYILNVPDNVRGTFVWRRGFHEALRLVSPDREAAVALTQVLSVYQVWDERAPIAVAETAANTFTLQLASGSVAGGPSSTPLYSLSDWTGTGFTARFTAAAGNGLVLYFTPHEVRVAGTLSGAPVPFGIVDLPKDEVVCGGQVPSLEGWTLDAEGIEKVTISIATTAGPGARLEPLGDAERVVRPDVSAVYPGFPDSARAGWTYQVPCARLSTVTGSGATLHVVSTNRRGVSATIGTRPLRLRQ